LTLVIPTPARRSALRFDASRPVLLAFSAALCLLIVLPLSWLVYYSVRDRAGGFTLANFVELATDPTFLDPLVTTVILALSSAAICCAVAAPMGWLVARRSSPRRFSAQ
jgi:iron(III) transport system permease protein